MRILVTGAAGFIGSNLVYFLLGEEAAQGGQTPERVIGYDLLTYAGSRINLELAQEDERFAFVEGDIRDRAAFGRVLDEEQIDVVLHLAAESHVDRSIDGPAEFLDTNITGTFQILEAIRERSGSGSGQSSKNGQGEGRSIRLLHVSTDEVYGSLSAEDEPFTEETPYAPNSPYSASKAASDHLVRAWHHTYGLDVVTTNCSNNYGPYQFPEKLIPLMISKAAAGENLPVYGDGSNRRDWLHVLDHARGIWLAAIAGKAGECYNFGGGAERSNLELIHLLLELLHERGYAKASEGLIEYVADRPGHDWRYAINNEKAVRELNWQPRETLESGMAQTVDWYLSHGDWLEAIRAERYDGGRLGA